MERLTYFENGHWRLNFDGCQYSARFVDRLAAYENTGLMPGEVAELQALLQGCESKKSAEWVRLQELAEADKDGRVMVLPCKVGDTVWYVTTAGILRFAITNFVKNCDGDYAVSDYTTFPIRLFGKNVFLTREEAEAKLKEVQKDGNKADM